MVLASTISNKKNTLDKRQGLHTFFFLLTMAREVVFKAKDDC